MTQETFYEVVTGGGANPERVSICLTRPEAEDMAAALSAPATVRERAPETAEVQTENAYIRKLERQGDLDPADRISNEPYGGRLANLYSAATVERAHIAYMDYMEHGGGLERGEHLT